MRAFPVLKGTIFSLIALSGALATNAFANEQNIARFYDDNQSYWAQFLPNVNASLNKDIDVDVAVIGGGYTGLSAAYHIKKSNPASTVVILEAKREFR